MILLCSTYYMTVFELRVAMAHVWMLAPTLRCLLTALAHANPQRLGGIANACERYVCAEIAESI